MNEAITLLSSSQWSDRRDGLENMKKTLNAQMAGKQRFKRPELKRICEIFSRLFSDQHTKVFSIFLDTLSIFISMYRDEIRDWLFVLLTRLIIKQGGENLSTVSKKIITCLETVRLSFSYDIQFKAITTFIKDNSIQVSNYKVRIAALGYMQLLLCNCTSQDVQITDDLKYAMCRIVAMTAEPKSAELRKAAQAVIITHYNLNPPEFVYLCNMLPASIGESATKIVKAHCNHIGVTEKNSFTAE